MKVVIALSSHSQQRFAKFCRVGRNVSLRWSVVRRIFVFHDTHGEGQDPPPLACVVSICAPLYICRGVGGGQPSPFILAMEEVFDAQLFCLIVGVRRALSLPGLLRAMVALPLLMMWLMLQGGMAIVVMVIAVATTSSC